jgi:DNA-binding NarL/FixJ family response regulator
MVVLIREGKTRQTIAFELGCHPQTVPERVTRFKELGDRSAARYAWTRTKIQIEGTRMQHNG